MKKLLIILMVQVCLISCIGCKDEKTSVTTGKKADNVTVGAIVTDIAADAEYINTEDDILTGSITGQQNTVYGNLGTTDVSEILPTWQDAYKIANISSESDAAATALRNKILNSGDSIKISGKKYYVSSINGNDENDGTSPERALKTLAKTSKLSLKEGDAVLLERGSVFRLNGSYTLKNGVTYAAYGKGSKPAVYGSSRNYADISLWKPYEEKANIWVMDNTFPGDVGNIVFDHGSNGCNGIDYVLSLSENGDFYYDEVNSKLYLYYDKGNPGRNFKDIEISPRFVLFSIPTGGHDITIDNISLKYSGSFAIRGLELDNVNITNCEIAWIGGAWQANGLARFGNGIEVGGVQNSTWKNNWIYQIFDSAITFQLDTNTVKNNYFTENLLEYCGMSSFEWWQSTKDGVIDGIIEDVYFTDNISRFPGYGWSQRGGRHIQGPFQSQDYPNMKNFVIKNNIFDSCNGSLSCWIWYTPDVNKNRYLMSNNTYYQKKTENSGNIFGYALDRESGTYYANDQKSFENAVALMEKNPKLVKWLG